MANAPVSARFSDPERIVLLVAGGELANIAVNDLVARFGPISVLQEEPESKWDILRRRARLVGPLYAVSQAVCGLALKVVGKASRARIEAICAENGLSTRAPSVVMTPIGSVNSRACRRELRALKPKLVAVYGTRIICRRTLACVDAPFINYHAGITPKYRGQHPAYCALTAGDRANVGVTVHLVDEGVDTGAVLYQAPVEMTPRDNITTYQYVQMAAALPLFARAIEDALDGRLRPQTVDLPSIKWFPPTLWQYVHNGVRCGVW